MANIEDMKALLSGGGARNNQFTVDLIFPTFVRNGTLAGQHARFLCKSASLPESTIEDVPVKYRGRTIHFSGERTFQNWTVSIYNDTNFLIRNALEEWQSGIQNYASTEGKVNPIDYQVDLIITQLNRAGDPIKAYKIVDAMPLRIGSIALDYDTENSIETFDVDFTYNYFTTVEIASIEGTSINSNVGNTPI